MNIYVASSWRNTQQPGVVQCLRVAGHAVYDFRHPREGDNGFHWSEIDPNWQQWTPHRYREALSHPIAERGFQSDMQALHRCDAVVAVQPFGRSASLELGWAAGTGKLTILRLSEGEPELMVKMCTRICTEMSEVVDHLQRATESCTVSGAADSAGEAHECSCFSGEPPTDQEPPPPPPPPPPPMEIGVTGHATFTTLKFH